MGEGGIGRKGSDFYGCERDHERVRLSERSERGQEKRLCEDVSGHTTCVGSVDLLIS